MDINFKSPFKFLDPYEKTDRDNFFGRDKEVRLLYDFVNKNRVVLVYGQSGTGKTSIIQCGLANEFDVTEWNPFFIRRSDNLNEAFITALKNDDINPTVGEIKNIISLLFDDNKDSKNQPSNEDDNVNEHGDKADIARIVYHLKKITEKYLRPVYLIFDQFEELLILASENEKELFIKTLKALLSHNSIVDCHIIIVMREEYFAWLDNFENDIPGLSDRRLRVETMRIKEIRNVILESCRNFNITLSDPEHNADKMIEAIADRGDVALPYMQVYLDQLWRKDYERTYPKGGYDGNSEFVPLTFTTEEIAEFGEIKDVMQRFLMERKKILQDDIAKTYPAAPVNFVSLLLDCFVNDRGTKIPNAYLVENSMYVFKKKTARLLRETDPKLLKFTLDFLQANQILRNDGNTFELGHDILAKLIDRQRDAKQKKLNGIRTMISIQKKSGESIPYDMIKRWEAYIDQLDLKEGDRAYFEQCRAQGEKKELDKMYKEELTKAIQKRKNRVNKRLLIFALPTIVFLLFMYWDSLKREDSYYARDIISLLDTVPNKRDALDLMKYVYDFKKNNDRVKRAGSESMMKIVSSSGFAKNFEKSRFQLRTAATLVSGFDVDISGNGKFICVKNDSIQSQNSLFLVLNLEQKKVIDSFKNVKYAYFLSNSDTLLLGLLDDSSRIFNDYPDCFLLYDCKNGKAIDTVLLNTSTAKGRRLYNKDFLIRYKFSEWDSYNVRLLSSGELLIPYFVSDEDNVFGQQSQVMLYNLATAKTVPLFNGSSNFSISTSRNNDKALYCYVDNGVIAKVYKSGGSMSSPFINMRYAEFTENGDILFIKQRGLYVCDDNGRIKKSYTSTERMEKFYTGGDYNYFLALDYMGNVNLLNLKDTLHPLMYEETLISYNFGNKTFITKTRAGDQTTRDSVQLILRDFTGKILNRVNCKYGIESGSFNEKSNCMLIKSNKLPNNLQLLYLYDDALVLKGSFFLTPNDSYGFSKDGKIFFFVRDNELSAFDNKAFVDLSNFGAVNDWLEKGKNENYDQHIKSLLKQYDIKKFPTQTFGL